MQSPLLISAEIGISDKILDLQVEGVATEFRGVAQEL